MHPKTLSLLPLSALFASLLSACPTDSGCESDVVELENKVGLTPEEYMQWQQGAMTGTTTGDPTTGAGESTGAGTTGASTGGEPLTDQEVCTGVCTQEFGAADLKSCSLEEQATKVVVTCTTLAHCVGGRGHACVAALAAAQGPDAAALWLARAAHDEEGSVHAFRALARELASRGAPDELLARIEAAARDEVRHATTMTALARRRGAEVTRPTCVPLPARGLREIALENAIEGCVHETWAALSAAHQARRAADPRLRAVFAAIARDEARHAELAWAIDAWLSSQLETVARAEVAAARRAAGEALVARLAAASDESTAPELGLPPARTASDLCAALGSRLWAA
jgi:rubrerythrin